jgi:hypothetical protein
LGSPKLHVARKSAVASIKAGADKHAANILPIIKEAQRARATTLRQIAEALNARGVATARGGQWHAMSVKNKLNHPRVTQGTPGMVGISVLSAFIVVVAVSLECEAAALVFLGLAVGVARFRRGLR